MQHADCRKIALSKLRIPKSAIVIAVAFLAACALPPSELKHISPVSIASHPPSVCKIAGILPGSPAEKAGLRQGDLVDGVNGVKPGNAASVSGLVRASGPSAALDVRDAFGIAKHLNVALNESPPRLGAVCVLDGLRTTGVSAADNETVTVFSGPYSLKASGLIDQGLLFMRVRVANASDQPLAVEPGLFSLWDANQGAMHVLSPEEVMFFLNGEDAVPLLQPPAGVKREPTIAPLSIARRVSAPHPKRARWSQADQASAEANAKYLSRESLWPATAVAGGSVEGLIFCLEPEAFPFQVQLKMKDALLAAAFEPTPPASKKMAPTDLARLFERASKGAPLRLTIKDGKVFSGKFSSYDPVNEVVWLDSPSGLLLNSRSFGLRSIKHAEALTAEAGKDYFSN